MSIVSCIRRSSSGSWLGILLTFNWKIRDVSKLLSPNYDCLSDGKTLLKQGVPKKFRIEIKRSKLAFVSLKRKSLAIWVLSYLHSKGELLSVESVWAAGAILTPLEWKRKQEQRRLFGHRWRSYYCSNLGRIKYPFNSLILKFVHWFSTKQVKQCKNNRQKNQIKKYTQCLEDTNRVYRGGKFGPKDYLKLQMKFTPGSNFTIILITYWSAQEAAKREVHKISTTLNTQVLSQQCCSSTQQYSNDQNSNPVSW